MQSHLLLPLLLLAAPTRPPGAACASSLPPMSHMPQPAPWGGGGSVSTPPAARRHPQRFAPLEMTGNDKPTGTNFALCAPESRQRRRARRGLPRAPGGVQMDDGGVVDAAGPPWQRAGRQVRGAERKCASRVVRATVRLRMSKIERLQQSGKVLLAGLCGARHGLKSALRRFILFDRPSVMWRVDLTGFKGGFSRLNTTTWCPVCGPQDLTVERVPMTRASSSHRA